MEKVTWFNVQTLHLIFAGDWTLEEYFEITDTAKRMLKESKHDSIDAIIDATQSNGFPKGENMMPHVKRVFQIENLNRVVFVGGSSFGLTLIRLFAKMVPSRQRKVLFAKTLAEAEALLEESLNS